MIPFHSIAFNLFLDLSAIKTNDYVNLSDLQLLVKTN